MKLSDLNLPIDYNEAKNYALVFNEQLANRLTELHHQYGKPDCIPMPLQMTDGRFMLCADILTAIEPGGWLYDMWQMADKTILLSQVDVIPWVDAVSLLPSNIID
jgi:hypothetical protein